MSFKGNLRRDWVCECGAHGSSHSQGLRHERARPGLCHIPTTCGFCGKANTLTPSKIRNGKRGFCGPWCADQFRLKPIPKLIEDFHGSYIPEPNSGCWLWDGPLDTHGYGVVSVRHRHYKATHVALAISDRPVISPKVACHKCDVPACVNPAHLFVGTKKENTRDSMTKGRFRPWGRPVAR